MRLQHKIYRSTVEAGYMIIWLLHSLQANTQMILSCSLLVWRIQYCSSWICVVIWYLFKRFRFRFIFGGRIRSEYLPQEFEGFSLKKWEGWEFFLREKNRERGCLKPWTLPPHIYPDYCKGQIKVLTVSLPKIDHIYPVLECKKKYPFQGGQIGQKPKPV